MSGRAALSSATSTAIRASSPSRTAVSAAASSSIVRTRVAAPIAFAWAIETALVGGRDDEGARHLADRLGDEQVAQVGEQVAGELGRVAPRARHLLDPEQDALRVLGDHRVDGLEEQLRVDRADHLEHRLELDLSSPP